MIRSVCAPTSPSITFCVAGSMATCPETKTKPLAFTAWENGPMDAGAFAVETMLLLMAAELDTELANWQTGKYANGRTGESARQRQAPADPCLAQGPRLALPAPGRRRPDQRRRLRRPHRRKARRQRPDRQRASQGADPRRTRPRQAHQAVDVLQTRREADRGSEAGAEVGVVKSCGPSPPGRRRHTESSISAYTPPEAASRLTYRSSIPAYTQKQH